jgi:hypothetical protein
LTSHANKIELNGEILLDLTQDTATEADVAEGKTFHRADGVIATGTMVAGGGIGGGGGSLPAGVYFTASSIKSPTNFRHKRFMFNGELYAIWYNAAGNGYANRLSKWNGSAWESVLSSQLSTMDGTGWKACEYNGKMHFIEGKSHYVFDGTTFTNSTDLPEMIYGNPVIYQGKIVAYVTTGGNLYEWDDTNSAWVSMAKLANNNDTYYAPFTYNDTLYLVESKKLYIYNDGVLNEVATLSRDGDRWYIYNGKAIYFDQFNGKAYFIVLSNYAESIYTIPAGIYQFSVIPDSLFVLYYKESSKSTYSAYFDVIVIEATE